MSAWIAGLICAVVIAFVMQWNHAESLDKLIKRLDEANSTLRTTLAREKETRLFAEAQEQLARTLNYRTDIQYTASLIENGDHEVAIERLRRHSPVHGEEDLRDFAWYLLRSFCPDPPITLSGHQHPVLSSAVAHERDLLVTGDKEGTIIIWNASTGVQIETPEKFFGEVCDLQFSPDESLMAACGTGGIIRIYRTEDWTPIQTLIGHKMTVKSVVFTPNGQQLISGSRDNDIVFWNTDSWQPEHRIMAHDTVQHIAISADGKWLSSGGSDGHTKVWNVETREFEADFHEHDLTVLCTAISDDGSLIASGGYDHHICIWNRNSAEMVGMIDSRQTAWSLDFQDSGSTLIAGRGNGWLSCYEVSATGNWELVSQTSTHASQIRSLEILQNPTRTITASEDSDVKILHQQSSHHVSSPENRGLMNIRFSSDGARIIVGHFDGEATIFDRGGQPIKLIKIRHFARDSVHSNYPAVAFKDDDVALLAGLESRWCNLDAFDFTGKANRRKIDFETGILLNSLSPDGKLLATLANETLQIWSTSTLKMIDSMTCADEVRSIEFSDDGSVVALAMEDASPRVWYPKTDRVMELDSLYEGVSAHSMAIDSGNRWFVSGNSSRNAEVWDLETGKRIVELAAPSSVNSLAFSPDGNLLAVGSNNVRLFDVNSWELILAFGELTDDREYYRDLRFSPSGDCLTAVTDTDGSQARLHIWDTHQLREGPTPKAATLGAK